MAHRILAAILLFSGISSAAADSPAPIPHGQHRAPGPALSPAEAISKMTVPEGFQVELVAAEPDIVNPVAMTFDERGRVWITESLEYPRRDAGSGRDRVKILEDTDHDGRADRFTIFADDLNIPSGIAVGAGGVWVANAPDILFMQDTDGDGRADRREVVVTGFGRDDTHELPNSLTWGPDGWLYGLNGVFNRSVVRQGNREYKFTAAMFRIDPRSRRFELFAEGTSNPWGIAWDTEGSAFVSACVIDHLWHLVETGYYHRQAGAYPPFAWKIESIVAHAHQQAAYCGIHYFDSEAYPAQYRGKLYMGNIHAGAINSDSLARNGSTYQGQAEPDFLTANDAWFMPVVQKTGPDGCLYVLDWYDRYHCYQDAGRDPTGIDRAKGRLYRIRYKDTPRAPAFDLSRETDRQLIERLRSPNVFFRDMAQRLLADRAQPASNETDAALAQRALDPSAARPARMHALWALVSRGPLGSEFHARLLDDPDAGLRAWGVRAAGNQRQVEPAVVEKIKALPADPAPEVRLQVAIAAGKIEGLEPIDVLINVLVHSPDDPLIPRIVWQNLHPRLPAESGQLLAAIEPKAVRRAPGVTKIVPRIFDKLLSVSADNPAPAAQVLALHIGSGESPPELDAARQCLAILAAKIQSHEIAPERVPALREVVEPFFDRLFRSRRVSPLEGDAALVAVSWRDPMRLKQVRSMMTSDRSPDEMRIRAFSALAAANDPQLLSEVEGLLVDTDRSSTELRRALLGALARLDQPAVAELALRAYPRLEAELQPQAIVLLASRPGWGRALLAAIADGRVPASEVNANQIRRLLIAGDEELKAEVARVWGTLRTERSPDRDRFIAQTRQLLRTTPGDTASGRAVFGRVCGNCHKIYGQGQEVGPDITSNGRGSFDQLVTSVLDPSLVIGAAYQARTIVTGDGRILTGLLAEESPERVVLKQQGGKLEAIPRGEITQIETSKLSLMPEDLDKQLKPQELVDLLTFLALDRPPEDPEAQWLSGYDGPPAREENKP